MMDEKNNPSKQTSIAKSLVAPNSGINFTIQKKDQTVKNTTGLPNNLKTGIEYLSGIDISDVSVHYNSSQPAQLNAHAYAQGNQIHIAPGQEKHLPHEAWHVVQQKQGRVKPTKQLKGKVNINDDLGLEKEADLMGAKALQGSNANKLLQASKTTLKYATVQRAKDAHEMNLEGFGYQDIVNWDGSPGIHSSVHFVSDYNILIMQALRRNDQNNTTYMEVRYNPNHVSEMTPQARYVAILHELAHIHYQHPGNQHPDSLQNEIQADDAAVVNTITLNPFESLIALRDIRSFIDLMETKNVRGGVTHPDNASRKRRIGYLQKLILIHSTVEVHLESNFTPHAQLMAFLKRFDIELLIERKDIKTFDAQNGKFAFIDGKGVVPLNLYLTWRIKFERLKQYLPSIRQTFTWVRRPVEVQNEFKDTI